MEVPIAVKLLPYHNLRNHIYCQIYVCKYYLSMDSNVLFINMFV